MIIVNPFKKFRVNILVSLHLRQRSFLAQVVRARLRSLLMSLNPLD